MKRIVLASVLAFSFVAATDAVAAKTHSSSDALSNSLLRQAPGLRREVLTLALDAAQTAGERGLVPRRDIITVIDYSLPSTQPRLFVFDLSRRKLLFRELVAHGKNSGGNLTN